jgi:hypothetical protein
VLSIDKIDNDKGRREKVAAFVDKPGRRHRQSLGVERLQQLELIGGDMGI